MSFGYRLLVGLVLVLAVMGQDFLTMGIYKPEKQILKDFSEYTNKILNSIRYMQLYDVMEMKEIWPIQAFITLSEIEIKNLNVVSNSTPESLQIDFAADSSSATIKSLPAFKLGLSAELSFKWKYKINSMNVYRGSATATLKTNGAALSFSMLNNLPNYTAIISFSFTLENMKVKGFGESTLVAQHVTDIFIKNCYGVLNEEMNRYNDLILAYVEFNYYYRNIKLDTVVRDGRPEDRILKNSFNKFKIYPLEKGIAFAFNSTVFETIQHTHTAIDSDFTPNYTKGQYIGLTFGLNPLKKIADVMEKDTNFTKFEITPEIQNKLFGYTLSVRHLIAFFPSLVNNFEINDKLTLVCTKPVIPGMPTTYAFECNFKQYEKEQKVVVKINRITLKAEFSAAPTKIIEDNKNITFGSTKFIFTEIELPIKMPAYLEREFINFLQPVSQWMGNKHEINLKVVGDELGWKFKEAASDQKSYTILYYDA